MQELNIGQLIKFYLRHVWIILVATLVGGGIGLFYSQNIVKPEYQSNSTVILEAHSTATDATLVNNYITLLKSRKVLMPIIEEQRLGVDYGALYDDIKIENQKNTEIVNISVTASEPEQAQLVNAALIDSFNLDAMGLNEEEEVTEKIITVIDEASVSEAPVNIRTTQNVAIMAVAGMALSMVILFAMFDRKVAKLAKTRTHFVSQRDRKVVGTVIVAPAMPPMAVEEVRRERPLAPTSTTPASIPLGPSSATPRPVVSESEMQNMGLMRQEATDMLDVLQNIGGVEIGA